MPWCSGESVNNRATAPRQYSSIEEHLVTAGYVCMQDIFKWTGRSRLNALCCHFLVDVDPLKADFQ